MRIKAGWQIFLIICLMISALAPSVPFNVSADTTDAWWHNDWPYRVQVTPSSSGPVSVNLNFTHLFAELGLQEALLNPDSLRVVPYQDGSPSAPVPFEESYSSLFLDADTLNRDQTNPEPYWQPEHGWTLSLDNTDYTQGEASVHAHVQVTNTSLVKSGFIYHFNNLAGVDWSDYELLLYDVKPQVNDTAIDQTPDLYFFEFGGLRNCPIKVINGPALVIDTWNSGLVPLKPYGNCQAPDKSTLEFLRFFVRVNRSYDHAGYFDPGDEMDLWLDNFRLVDQDGSGTIRWDSDPSYDSYYVYFDTIEHTGHPKPSLTSIPGEALALIPESPEAGGYFHNLSNASTGALSIWAAPTAEKILKTLTAPVSIKPLTIFGAKGEFEPIQLVINAPSTQALSVSASHLVHENGLSTIPANQIDIFRVDYVNILHLSDYYGRATAWPDPLHPLSHGELITFPAGINQPLWIRVKIPTSALPGTYSGQITIGSAIVPFSLKVWGFNLTSKQTLENQAGVNWPLVMETYQGTIDSVPHACHSIVEEAIAATLKDYRITPGETLPADVVEYSLTAYEVNQAHQQQLHEDKRVYWGYTSMDHPPHINPAVMDRTGIEPRLLPWLAWLDRVDGLYYYQLTDWDPDPWNNVFSNGLSNGDGFFFYPPKDTTLGFDPCNPASNRLIPSIRLELLREGLEDYAYLWQLNLGKPEINQDNPGDPLAQSIVASRTMVNRIPTAFDPIRQEIAEILEARQSHIYLPMLIH
jgi:hypothetical protein